MNTQEIWNWGRQKAFNGYHKNLEYQRWMLWTIGFFSAIYAMSFIFCLVCNQKFQKMNRQKKADYVGRFISIVHAIIVSIVAIVCTFFLCDKPESNILNDRNCFQNPNQFHEAQTVFTCAYFLFDFLVTLLLINDFSPLGFQTYLHHVIGVTSYYIAVISPFKGALSISVAISMVEISTPFMHFRQYLFIHGLGESILQVINSFFFFTTFLNARVIFLSFLTYKTTYFWTENFPLEGVAIQHKVSLGILLSCQLIAMVLNFYWFQLICKQVMRMLTKKSSVDPSKKDTKDIKQE